MMKKYLRDIHSKPESHQKRFAFLVSAGCTLLIFSLWSFVRFGIGNSAGTTPVQNNNAAVLLAGGPIAPSREEEVVKGPTPFENMKSGFNETMNMIKNGLSEDTNTATTNDR